MGDELLSLEEAKPLLEHDASAIGHSFCGIVQRLLVGMLCLIALIVPYAIFGSTTNDTKHSMAAHDVCLSPDCVMAASDILRSRSPNYINVDPCEDFETYMCEGFDQTHDIRDDQSSTSTLSVMAEEGQTVLRHILEAPFPDAMPLGENAEADKHNFEKLQGGYQACMNETAIKLRGFQPVADIVRDLRNRLHEHGFERQLESRIASGHEQKSHSSQLSKVLGYFMAIGIEPLIALNIQADEKSPDVNVLYLTAPYSFGLPTKEYYLNEKVVDSYTAMLEEVDEQLEKESMNEVSLLSKHVAAKDVVHLEKQLAAASPDEEVREDITKYYNPMSLHDVSDMVPQLGLEHLIARANPDFKPDTVIVGSPHYLKRLNEILSDTDDRLLLDYLLWKLIQVYASAVDSPVVQPIKRFSNVLGGKDPDAKSERWRTCLRYVDGGLGWLLSRFYIEKAFSEDAKNFGDRIILDIKDEFTHKLHSAEWMSKDVRKVAIDKVHNIVQKIGYPTESPDIRKPQQLQAYYANVNISAHDHFGNIISVHRDDFAREWAKAGGPVDRGEWGMTASTVNAYYNPAGNEIVFPAGIMQPPIFHGRDLPLALSYGAFGAVAGHELSHAFDSSGRHFDQDGAFADSWWDDATIAAFENRTSCFVREYANFTVPGLDGAPVPVNGRLTLGENLADAGGLSAAFNAWRRREDELAGADGRGGAAALQARQRLPGLLEYSPEQLFFLAFGNVWCGRVRPAEAARRVYGDPHSPPAARIQGTLANSGEFREAFGCPVRLPTCKLW